MLAACSVYRGTPLLVVVRGRAIGLGWLCCDSPAMSSMAWQPNTSHHFNTMGAPLRTPSTHLAGLLAHCAGKHLHRHVGRELQAVHGRKHVLIWREGGDEGREGGGRWRMEADRSAPRRAHEAHAAATQHATWVQRHAGKCTATPWPRHTHKQAAWIHAHPTGRCRCTAQSRAGRQRPLRRAGCAPQSDPCSLPGRQERRAAAEGGELTLRVVSAQSRQPSAGCRAWPCKC